MATTIATVMPNCILAVPPGFLSALGYKLGDTVEILIDLLPPKDGGPVSSPDQQQT